MHPKGFLIAGVVILLTGLGFNYFLGRSGEIQLVSGKKTNLSVADPSATDSVTTTDDLGLIITLDSVKMESYTPAFEIKLLKKDTVSVHTDYQQGATFSTIGVYPMEQMKIRSIEKSDLRFRLKDFYPNFEFAYQYPDSRDTIEPKAPGITLELKTKEGKPIVTLRADQPGKNVLGDIVSLGASLNFYWDITRDSVDIIAMHKENGKDKVVFSGADSVIYFLLQDTIIQQPLKENDFYTIPGHDSSGFTILYCFPDIAYLKAVPSSKGTELLNPVAHVEIWNEGGSARDAFLYPETRTRKGGDFAIPNTDYKLGLSTDKEQKMEHCTCSLSIQKDSSQAPVSLTFLAGHSGRYHNYSFRPVDCTEGHPASVIIGVTYQPGRSLVIIGIILSGLAFIFFLARRNRAFTGQKS